MDAGGIRVVLTVRTAHAGGVRMQLLGCVVIHLFAPDNDIVLWITDAGGIQVVVTAMMVTVHSGDLVMQDQGCKTLCFLACDNDHMMTIMGADGA